MADVSLRAELQLKDGQRQKICVQVHEGLRSLIGGIHEVNVNVSQLLTQIVDRDKKDGAVDEEEDGDEDEDSDEDEASLCQHPPAKRLKP